MSIIILLYDDLVTQDDLKVSESDILWKKSMVPMSMAGLKRIG